MYAVYSLITKDQTITPQCQLFDQLNDALKQTNFLRNQDNILFVDLVADSTTLNVNAGATLIGEDMKLPDQTTYTWTKRR